MGSDYPAKLDVFPILLEGDSYVEADYANRLTGALFQIQTILGTDPSNPGAAWATMTDLADLLGRFVAFEAGTFEVEYPADAPIQVLFQNPSRFTDATKLFVQLNAVGNQRGTRTGQDNLWNVTIEESGGSPIGFNFYRFNMDGLDRRTASFAYLAIEDRF